MNHRFRRGNQEDRTEGRIEPFAHVRLVQPFRDYPAGEEGAVVDEYPGTDDVMVEFVNDWENDLRVFTVPCALLELVTE